MPDLFVPLDTSTELAALPGALVRRGVLNTTAISFVGRPPAATPGFVPESRSFQQDFQVEGGLYDLLWSEASAKAWNGRKPTPRTAAIFIELSPLAWPGTHMEHFGLLYINPPIRWTTALKTAISAPRFRTTPSRRL